MQDEFDDTTVAVYDGLLTQALREIQSPAATPGQRIAWADAAEFALEHLPDTEARVAETLSIAARTLHSPGVVSRLITGVWSCTGCRSYDGTRKRLLGWVINLADRAIRSEHWATFAWLAHTTIRLDGVERELPAEWERGIRAAYDLPSTWVSLYLFAYHYGRKFAPDVASAPDWFRLLRSDPRLQDAFQRESSLEQQLPCPVCKRVDP